MPQTVALDVTYLRTYLRPNQMKIVFTKSESILSEVICKITGESVSHCAVVSGDYVMHSNLYGVHIDLLSKFLASTTVVFSIDMPADADKMIRLIKSEKHKSYDYGGLLYCGLRLMFPALPKKNLWQTTGMYMCTEWVQEALGQEKIDSMITPYGLYLQLLQKQKEGDKI